MLNVLLDTSKTANAYIFNNYLTASAYLYNFELLSFEIIIFYQEAFFPVCISPEILLKCIKYLDFVNCAPPLLEITYEHAPNINMYFGCMWQHESQ